MFIFSLVLGCKNSKIIEIKYFPNGDTHYKKEEIDIEKYRLSIYFENGLLEKEWIEENGKLNGEYKEFDTDGNLISLVIYKNGLKENKGTYYKNGVLESINLFKQDSFYFIEEYANGDTTEFIKPIIILQELDTIDKISRIKIKIPFEPFFRHYQDTIIVHYDIMEYKDGLVHMPRKNRLKFHKENEKKIIEYSYDSNKKSYIIQGLVTTNDESLQSFDQNYFEYVFINNY